MMECSWRLHIYGYDEWLIGQGIEFTYICFWSSSLFATMIVFKDIFFYPYRNYRLDNVCMCVFNMVPESFVSFILKKYVHYYMFPEWFKV